MRPSEFSHQYLRTLDASEGRRKRRKRDTTPDSLGLQLKRELLERVVQDDPEPERFDAWLLEQTLNAPASGPLRAMGVEISSDYRLAAQDPSFGQWLAQGAPSADSDTG